MITVGCSMHIPHYCFVRYDNIFVNYIINKSILLIICQNHLVENIETFQGPSKVWFDLQALPYECINFVT